MEEKYFVKLKKLYADFKKNYKTRADEQRKITCSQIKTKGRIYDVFPYHAEQYGYKTKGKVVDEIEMKDDNFIFYFDQKSNLKLIQRVEGLWRENRYNAVKISNKKLETVMEYQLMELWKDVQCYVNNTETPVYDVRLFLNET